MLHQCKEASTVGVKPLNVINDTDKLTKCCCISTSDSILLERFSQGFVHKGRDFTVLRSLTLSLPRQDSHHLPTREESSNVHGSIANRNHGKPLALESAKL